MDVSSISTFRSPVYIFRLTRYEQMKAVGYNINIYTTRGAT